MCDVLVVLRSVIEYLTSENEQHYNDIRVRLQIPTQVTQVAGQAQLSIQQPQVIDTFALASNSMH